MKNEPLDIAKPPAVCWCCHHPRYSHLATGCTNADCSCILSWVELVARKKVSTEVSRLTKERLDEIRVTTERMETAYAYALKRVEGTPMEGLVKFGIQADAIKALRDLLREIETLQNA